jgi:CheY-like chemotaxis protein/signal transduction histidine kinase
MPDKSVIEDARFRRILTRNIAIPVAVGIATIGFFVCIIYYLLSVARDVEHSDRVISQGNAVFKLLIDMETGMRGYLVGDDPVFLEPYNRARDRLDNDFGKLTDLVSDNPEQVATLRQIQAVHGQWLLHAESARLKRERDDLSFVQDVRSQTGKRQMDDMRARFNQFLAAEEGLRIARTEFSEKVTTFAVSVFIILILVLNALVAYRGRRELVTLSSTFDEALQKEAAHSQELQRQGWYQSAEAALAEHLIGQLSVAEVGNNTLDFLARQIHMAVGALYVAEDGRLRRVSAYAFDEEQMRRREHIELGHGLIGQAAAERRPIALENLPANYLRVSSAVGESDAHAVLIVPIIDSGDMMGVIELGFLRPLEQQDRELMRLLAGNIGSAISGANYRQRLQSVLAETQALNEELQVQQEELRSANEELEEQSSALRESQANLEAQQAELEQTNEQLSEQAHALASHRDELDTRNRDLGEAQRMLEARAEELQRASRYKSEFLANMSHELRTPLNSSLILAKLLADNDDGNLTEEQVKFASSIYSAGNDLLTLINDILDLSKVEAGKLDLVLEDAGLARVGENLRSLFTPLADQKGLNLAISYADGLPSSIHTDVQRLEQILKNLLSNAIKFTDFGEVRLHVEPVSEGRIAFHVRDSGIGIPQEQQDVIFEAFRQADGTTNRRYGGTGLGLSISREFAHRLGATLTVSSEVGKGSQFTLTMPQHLAEVSEPFTPTNTAPAARLESVQAALPPMPAATPPKAPAPAVVVPTFDDDRDQPSNDGRCVLIIEDEPQFAKILFDLAHELGYKCLVAHGADEGFSLAEGHQPDAILLDMRLPDHSGLTVLERLKENARTRHIPVHICSVEDRREAALHMGAVGYAMKPVSRDDLKSVFARLEAKLEQKVKRILVVEDDDLQRESISRLIEDDDIEIVAVGRGDLALDQLRETVFDCMIIDLKLPDMDGSQLLARMTEEDICSFPPVIVYTGRNLSRNEEAELLKYSRSIIIKGARSPERLLDEVTLFLHKVEADMPLERQRMLKTVRNRDRAFEGRRILLVDDDVRNIFALTSALEHKGATVEIARNGIEALEKLDQEPSIDLVLMDIMMPEMDGYEATERIRKDPRFKRLPIIAVTAKAMKDDQDRCLRAGANDYLAKPIDLDRLFSLIRVWLPKLEVF